MRKIFITGASGFVGSHVIDLLGREYFIIGLDFQKPPPSTDNIIYLQGDIQNSETINEVLQKYQPEVILHLAAAASSWQGEVKNIFQVNLFGTLNILENILEVKKTSENFNPKILYISSSEVYGSTNSGARIGEDAPLNPRNIYAASKVAADRLCYQYSQAQQLSLVIIRPFNHTGPRQRIGFFVPDMASQIAKIEKSGREGEIKVGNLESIRDFSDVRDVVRAYKALIDTDINPGEVYNICSGIGVKMSFILQTLLKFSKQKINIKQDPARLRISDTPVFIGDNQKLISKTGWKPQILLEKTLEDTLIYWRSVKD